MIELEAVQLDRVAEARLFDFDLVTHGARPAYGKGYAGRYGERTISSENDALYLQREGGPKLKLTPVSKDEYALEAVPEARLKFVRDESGRIKELQVLNRSGEWEISKRQ